MWPYLGPPRTDSCQIWCVEVFHHALPKYENKSMKMLKKYFWWRHTLVLYNRTPIFLIFCCSSWKRYYQRIIQSRFGLISINRGKKCEQNGALYKNWNVKLTFKRAEEWPLFPHAISNILSSWIQQYKCWVKC